MISTLASLFLKVILDSKSLPVDLTLINIFFLNSSCEPRTFKSLKYKFFIIKDSFGPTRIVFLSASMFTT
jgi:hypothetical protein